MGQTVKIAALILLAATVVVYATEWIPFMWPVMAVVDAGAVVTWTKRRKSAAA